MAFTGTINIGGIQYTFDPTKMGINYLYRNYHDFEKTFKPVAERSGISLERIKQLFIKYFRVGPFVKQDFAAIVATDKKDLIAIFEAYLKQLEISKEMSGNSVISIMLNRTYYEISQILMGLHGKPEDFTKTSVTCQASKDKLINLDDTIRKTMIAEFTWLLTNPKDIRSENACKWADMAAELMDVRLTDMTAELNPSSSQQGGSMDMMKSRLKSLRMVSIVLDTAKKCGCEDDEDYQDLKQSFSNAMLPLFNEIKKQYQPIYGVIENCMKRNHVKKK